MKSFRSLILAPIAAVFVLTATLRADPSGTWTWTRKLPEGKTVTSSLKLQVQDGKLSGTVSGPRGETPISDATFTADSVEFSVARAGHEGTKWVAKYQGKIDGDTIKGTITMPSRHGDKSKSTDWEAHRAAP